MRAWDEDSVSVQPPTIVRSITGRHSSTRHQCALPALQASFVVELIGSRQFELWVTLGPLDHSKRKKKYLLRKMPSFKFMDSRCPVSASAARRQKAVGSSGKFGFLGLIL